MTPIKQHSSPPLSLMIKQWRTDPVVIKQLNHHSVVIKPLVTDLVVIKQLITNSVVISYPSREPGQRPRSIAD